MKFLKNNLKVIIAFIVGVILASEITVYATAYLASQVTYKNDKTVEFALNELYSKINAQNDNSNEVKKIITPDSDDYSFTESYSKVYVVIARGNGTDGKRLPLLKKNSIEVTANSYFNSNSVNAYSISLYILDDIKNGDAIKIFGRGFFLCFE